MNAHIHRLIFSPRLGMYVPTHEAARARGKPGGGARRALLLALGVALAPTAAAQMPVPCAAGGCAAPGFVGAGAASFSQQGNQAVVTQTTRNAIVNWQSYNLGAGNTLTYRYADAQGNLPAGAAFSSLNRIWQGAPSEIAGRIQVQPGQNGQITLINQNGFLFKDGARVDTGSLVASTLDISDTLFLDGGPHTNLDAATLPAFLGDAAGIVRVESGAELRSASGGRVMLLARDVENHGLIETPEGQTVLAAGEKVYLAVSEDPRLRGFLVEVDGGGAATNTGRIIAERGNVSITGLSVNQSGRVTATTSVSLNGSIRLMARDSVVDHTPTAQAGEATPRPIPLGSRTGTLTLGADSVTEVLPDTADGATVLDEQRFNRSLIQGVARQIHVQGGARLSAPSGEIALDAQAGALFQEAGEARVADAWLRVDGGALLDVAGLRDVAIPVERNYIQVELRGDELKDAPLQRDSFLRGSTVWIDIEQGTPLADVSGYTARVGRTVAEKSTPGGDITLRAEGALLLNAGARLDVSGGSIAYQAGWGRTTQLALAGHVVDIGQASPDVVYDGFADRYSVTDAKWGVTRTWDIGRATYIPAYVAGRDAGRLSLSAHALRVDADLLGERVAGERQRASAPLGGLLAITGLAESNLPAALLGGIHLVGARPPAADADDAPADDTLRLSAEALRAGGFRRLALRAEGDVTLPADVTLDVGVGGEVTLSGRALHIDGTIDAPAGRIDLSTRPGQGEVDYALDAYALSLGATARLNVAGQWVNDLPAVNAQAPTAPYGIDGGRIRLAAHGDLLLAPGSLLDADGGARLTGGGRLTAGKGGAITLASGRHGPLTDAEPLTARLLLGGELRARALTRGGTLSISASRLLLADPLSGLFDADARRGDLHLDAGLFTRGGFLGYDLTGADGVRVADGFQLQPRPELLRLAPDHLLRASGGGLAAVSERYVADFPLRPTTQVRLAATGFFTGDVTLGAGAAIRVDPQGSITLSAARQLTVLGALHAPAGSLTLTQTGLADADLPVANFDPGRAVFLGADSVLDAAGYFLAEPNAQGLRRGSVLAGGSIRIDAGKGYIVHQTGARMDVSGATALLDLPTRAGLAATAVASDGGTILLSAREGMLLEGELLGHAGGAGALGGHLGLTLRRDKEWTPAGGATLPAALQQQRRITLRAQTGTLSAALRSGDALDTAAVNGEAVVSARQIEAGGFAHLTLDAQHRVRFADDVALALAGHVALLAPNLEGLPGTRVAVDAASMLLGTTRATAQGETLRGDARGGNATLTLSADLIELSGHASLQGFGATTLSSRGDLRARAVAYDDPVTLDVDYFYRGALTSGGDLLLAARQIYPVSMADFAIEIHNNPDATLSIAATGAPGTVLSAGGRLTLAAPTIVQGGTLKAPFGELALSAERIERVTLAFGANGLPNAPADITLTRAPVAEGGITLAPGSLTSVSADGAVIPLGRTELSGGDWLYDFGLYKRVLETPPTRRIVLDAADVVVAAGARVDLSGGGDLLAYEFMQGPGGSRDVLLPENSAGHYAILPGYDGLFAPHDAHILAGLDAGRGGLTVRLSEPAGALPAGDYTLLPARYALLPGAYLVRVAAEASDAVARGGTRLATGYTRVAGHVGVITAGGALLHDARADTLDIAPGDLARTRSEYLESRASLFFAASDVAQATGDAGRLSLLVGRNLTLAGELAATWAADARGPEVDITAPRLAVTADGEDYGDGYVSLSATQLQGFGAHSLLLGGMRVAADGADAQPLVMHAETVVIAAGARLNKAELLLAARDTVRVEDGAELTGGGNATPARALHLTDATGDGAGALLRLAAGGQAALTRAPVGEARGTLTVAAGAALRADGSMILDATRDTDVRGAITLPPVGGALTLGARRIILAGDGVTDLPDDGLLFDPQRLAALGNPAHLLLRGYGGIDLYGDATLGDTTLASLTLETGALLGHGAADALASLSARNLRLANPDGIEVAPLGALGAGRLRLSAETLELGAGTFTLRGFDHVEMIASQQLLGGHGTLRVHADGDATGALLLRAGLIATTTGATRAIHADGHLTTTWSGWDGDALEPARGGRLLLSGAALTHGARVWLPGGDIELHALGDLRLLTGATLDASGFGVRFADQTVYAPGGNVRLRAGGALLTEAGARVSVAGAADGGDAGTLWLSAGGDAVLAADLLGDAVAGHASGRVFIDAQRVNPGNGADNDYGAVNAVLNAGGFRALRHLRVRAGDLDIAAGLTTRAAEIVLAADGGDLRVAGTLDASGTRGGRIELYAGRDLSVAAGARLDARALTSVATPMAGAGEGGVVVLGSGDDGRLHLHAGALIDVSVPADSAAAGGRVWLRVARDADHALGVGALHARIVGARQVDLEAYRVYADVATLVSGASAGASLGLATAHQHAQAFMAAVDTATLFGELDVGDATARLRPGVEARATDALRLTQDWNLNALRYGMSAGGEEVGGILTLRAAGDLLFDAHLSDGFSTATSTGLLQSNPAGWDLRLVAGAGLAAANPLTTVGDGDVRIAANRLVRTGTGDIQVAAGRDIALDNGAALYSAGHATPAVSGFTVAGLTGVAFPTGGGDLRLRAGGSVQADAGPSGLLTDWLYRQGNVTAPNTVLFRSPGWWPQFAQFRNGVAALGGGDVAIEAGGRVVNLLAATVSNARQPASLGQPVDAAAQVIQGGGDLSIRAGGDITGGLFLADRGEALISTRGALVDGLARGVASTGTVLALGDARATVVTRAALRLAAVVNPGLVPQTSGNLSGTGGANRESYMVTYGADSGATLLAVAGDLTLVNDSGALTNAFGLTSGKHGGVALYPASLRAAALGGALTVEQGFTLLPSVHGDLQLLAAGDITKLGSEPIHLSDLALSRVPTLVAPRRDIASVNRLVTLPERESDAHGPELLHADSNQPVRVASLYGDIVGQPSPLVFAVLAKPALFQAGRDLLDVTVVGQHLRDDHVTRLLAGRDIRYAITRDATSGQLNDVSAARVAIGGPGRVELIAGRHVDLGVARGLITRGNLANPYLPEGGADLLVIAGALGRADDGATLPLDARLLDAHALTAFFAELAASGEEGAATRDYTRGERAIAALFPSEVDGRAVRYQGDINLFFSQFKTEQGGDITILAPGGMVNAGLASLSEFQRAAADLGILSVQGGAIRAYTRDDFQVNSSRVFTLSGGDILLWSAEGNIDAGKGAKTASATPPPRLRIDANGNFVLDVSQSIAGSGIGAMRAGSNVALIAPKGEVNAGDAGIRAGGNLTIAAERVVGADNIQVGGISTGVQAVDSSGLAGSLAGIGNLADTAGEATRAVSAATGGPQQDGARAMEEARQMLAAFKPSFITVEVLGFGE